MESSPSLIASLREENARLASTCNELAYQLVMHKMPVPSSVVAAAGHAPPPRAFPRSIVLSPSRKGLGAAYSNATAAREPDDVAAADDSGKVTPFAQASAVDDDAMRFLAAPTSGLRKTLRALSVADSSVSDDGVAALCTATAEGNGEEPLYTSLEELDLSGCTRVTDAAIAQLTLFRQLVVLDISRCGAGAVSVANTLRQHEALPKLQVFRAAGAVATDRVLAALACHGRQLREISLVDGGDALSDAGIAHFAVTAAESLARAEFVSCNAGDAAATALAVHSSKLQRLSLRGCKAVTNAGASRLAKAGALRELDLSGTSCTSAVMDALSAGNAPLEAVALGGIVVTEAEAAPPAPAQTAKPPKPSTATSQVSRKLEMLVDEPELARPVATTPVRRKPPPPMEIRRSLVGGFQRVQWVRAPGPGAWDTSSPRTYSQSASIRRGGGAAVDTDFVSATRKVMHNATVGGARR